MRILRRGAVTASVLGAVWAVVVSASVAVSVSFATGEAIRPVALWSLVYGAVAGLAAIHVRAPWLSIVAALAALTPLALVGVGPLAIEGGAIEGGAIEGGTTEGGATEGGMSTSARIVAAALAAAGTVGPLHRILGDVSPGPLTRHEFEAAVIRLLAGVGYVFFTAMVLIPFYVMVMTSLKSQQALLQNPLDFSIDLDRGWELLRSYRELVEDFDFATYMWTSFCVSVLTVAITLAFAIPGAYAVARLRFRGRAALVRSILLIYMVPMIVLALPIYIAFSVAGLRNSIAGIVMIYPVTTIPVAIYMLQGYFRGLPAEVEEAGLMDGLSRLAVIRKITLPLSLPALASVSLYVFMIAWNEFLLAFMLLDDPSKFTLTRGVAMLNSSEIPRQHLMAGAVMATLPIMVLFLGLERFMTRGLAAGSVKG